MGTFHRPTRNVSTDSFKKLSGYLSDAEWSSGTVWQRASLALWTCLRGSLICWRAIRHCIKTLAAQLRSVVTGSLLPRHYGLHNLFKRNWQLLFPTFNRNCCMSQWLAWDCYVIVLQPKFEYTSHVGWFRDTAVERWSLTGELSLSSVFYPGTFGGGNFPPPNFEFSPKNLRRGLLLCECNTCKLTECSKLTK